MGPLAALGLAIDQAQPRDAEAPASQDAGATAEDSSPFSAEFVNAAPAKKDSTPKNALPADESTAVDGVDQALIFLAELEPSATARDGADADIAKDRASKESRSDPWARVGKFESPALDPTALANSEGQLGAGVASIKALPPSLFEPEPFPGARAISDSVGVLTSVPESEIKIAQPVAIEESAAAVAPRTMINARILVGATASIAKSPEASPELMMGAVLAADLSPAHSAPAAPSPGAAMTTVATAVNPAHQILAAVRTSLDADGIEVRLEPPELGRVRIHFAFERADVVIATLSSERSDTLDLMRRHASDLVRELERSGFGSVRLEFQSGQGNAFAEPRPAASNFSEAAAAEPIDETQPLYFVRKSDKLLDRRV